MSQPSEEPASRSGSPPGERGFLAILLSFTLLALVLRLVQSGLTRVMLPDGAVFLRMARAFLDGDPEAALFEAQHPGYPALVALAGLFVSDLETAGRVVSALATAALVPIAAWLAREAQDVTAGCREVEPGACNKEAESLRHNMVAGAALAAFHPYLIRAGSSVMTEGVFLLFAGLTLLFGLRAIRAGGTLPHLLAGAFTGLAYLVRPEGLFFGGLVAAWQGGRLVLSAPRAPRALGLFAVLIGTLLTAGPYLGYLRDAEGGLTLTRKKTVSSLVAGTGSALEAPREASPERDVLRAVLIEREDEGVLGLRPEGIRGVAYGVLDTLGKHVAVLTPLLLLLAAFALFPGGAAGLPTRGSPARTFLLLAFLAYLGVLLLLKLNVGYLARRHLYAQVVILLPLAAAGAGRLFAWLQTRWKVPAGVGLGMTCALAGAFFLPKAIRPLRTEKAAVRELGLALRENLGRPPRILGREASLVAHYAGGTYVRLRSGTPEEVLGDAWAAGADYVVIFTRKAGPERVLPLFAEVGLHPMLVYEADAGSKTYVWYVFRIEEGPGS